MMLSKKQKKLALSKLRVYKLN